MSTSILRRLPPGLFALCMGLVPPAWSAVTASPRCPGAPSSEPGSDATAGDLDGASQDEAELAAALAGERREADRLRRRGETAKAQKGLTELLNDDLADAAARVLRGMLRMDECDWEAARKDLERGLKDAAGLADAAGARMWTAQALRQLLSLELTQGRSEAAGELAGARSKDLAPAVDARDAWVLARTAGALGRREQRLELLRQGAAATCGIWEEWLARARCERALGNLEAASRSLVAGDRLAASGDGPEPDVLAELASVYFEADGEIAHPEAQGRAPGVLYKQALELNPRHGPANLGLYELNRFNWNRQSRPAGEILEEWLRLRPASIEGLLAGAAADLDDGQLVAARGKLARLQELAPGRRELRTLQATLAWIEHREADAEALLKALASEDALDGRPERELGRILCELYRFGEGRKFLERAVVRDPADHEAWTQLGRSQANTGAEKEAMASLAKATELAAGRQNAWRFNTSKVLERIHSRYVTAAAGAHTFLWAPDASKVLEAYLVPFYAHSRDELSARYGFTPGPVQIEVFERHRDFSVRSTGFEGFPALGVCFGPVVTAVSPVSEMRGSFSWARTSFHEFTHVIHLGLSHNRCPRWITEGLATWEEVNREPSWTRNMRRELLDSRRSGELIGVRDLNRAFRGPRILFAYYQSGLWCQMMIERHGFAALVHLLEAFDRGLDLDGALAEVFHATPEELDRRFAEFVDAEIAELCIEPRWSSAFIARLQLELPPQPPTAPGPRQRWLEDTLSLAHGHWQSGSRIDAEQVLQRLDGAGLTHPRAEFLRGEISMHAGDKARAIEFWRKGLAQGGEDYRVRFALGRLAVLAGELETAATQFRAAEGLFPGYDDPGMSAETALADVCTELGKTDEAMEARSRWLRWNSGEYEPRLLVAAWHAKAERFAEAQRLYAEANEIDPFRRRLHLEHAEVLRRLERHVEALREYEVAALVPVELDQDRPPPLSDEDRARLLGLQADCLVDMGRLPEALGRIAGALELDPQCETALVARDRIPEGSR